MKKLAFNIILLISISASAQVSDFKDTIRISEVVINGRTFQSRSENSTLLIDSSDLVEYRHENIADVISDHNPIFIKNHGAGGISTISLRGTGAGYTQFAWNGLNINSPMLGQSDLTLMPAGFIDELNVLYGGASLSLNSGGIGGIINIETKPDWRKETTLQANLSAGSFSKYSTLLKLKTGDSKFQSSTRALYQSAENDFPYQNNFSSSDPFTEVRANAAVRQKAFMQEVYFRGEKNVVSARIWYQKSDRSIPVPISVQQPVPGETQTDEFLRTMLNYSSFKGRTDFNSSVSWFTEKLDYRNPLLSVDSRNLTNTFALKSAIRNKIDSKTNLDFIISDELSIVHSVNYSEDKSLNLAGLTVSFRRVFLERLVLSTLARQTIKDNDLLFPDFSMGLNYRIVYDREQYLKINFSHNSKVPTLNDLYWNPGGNSSLKNEYSYTGEITYDINNSITPVLTINGQITLYTISIDNMIRWNPGESGLWSPSNINKANSSGAETSFTLSYIGNPWKIRFNGSYTWNRAQIIKSTEGEFAAGKQIIYTPENMINTGIRGEYNKVYLAWITSYTGKRYTSVDNSEYLPGYLLNNVSAGIKLGPSKNTFDFNLKLENVFDISYQPVAWYPMPGRSFFVTISYQFLK